MARSASSASTTPSGRTCPPAPRRGRRTSWGPSHPRIGVLAFSARDVGYARLAAVLSAEHGIEVRHGCFCAHPLVAALLGLDSVEVRRLGAALRAGGAPRLPGAVRLSVGLGTTRADVDRLVDAVRTIVVDGPRWSYRTAPDGTQCWPDPDPRPDPPLSFELA